MMHFEGTEVFTSDPATVYAYLANAGRLARALPEGEIFEETPTQAAWKVRPKFAFMAGTLDTTATITVQQAEVMVGYRIVSTGVGSSSTMIVQLTLNPQTVGTAVQWTGDLTELGGLLRMVPRPMLQAAALKTISDVWTAIRKDLG
ncbi:MAG: SRPBCC domain-containing protein [Fimbriiglobus sp.]